jgi:hypothetical protein
MDTGLIGQFICRIQGCFTVVSKGLEADGSWRMDWIEFKRREIGRGRLLP